MPKRAAERTGKLLVHTEPSGGHVSHETDVGNMWHLRPSALLMFEGTRHVLCSHCWPRAPTCLKVRSPCGSLVSLLAVASGDTVPINMNITP